MAQMRTSLGLYLKTLREKNNLSQQQVAEAFKYESSQFISNWERGQSKPPIFRVKQLAELYKENPSALFDKIYKQEAEEFHAYYEKQKKVLGL